MQTIRFRDFLPLQMLLFEFRSHYFIRPFQNRSKNRRGNFPVVKVYLLEWKF